MSLRAYCSILEKRNKSKAIIWGLGCVKTVQQIPSVEWQPIKMLDLLGQPGFCWPRLSLLESRLSQTWQPAWDWTNNSAILLKGREGGWANMSLTFRYFLRKGEKCLDRTFFFLPSSSTASGPQIRVLCLYFNFGLIKLPGWSMQSRCGFRAVIPPRQQWEDFGWWSRLVH